MIKIDITIELNGEKITIGYAEGQRLFRELTLLYAPQKATVFEEAYAIVDQVEADSSIIGEDAPAQRVVPSSMGCGVATDENGNCTDDFDTKNFQGIGDFELSDCESDISISDADDVDTQYLSDTECDDGAARAMASQEEEGLSIDDVNAEISDRVAQMKAALDAVNNKD